MKKILLTVAVAVVTVFGAGAQLLQVRSMEKVRLPMGVRADQAMLSPDGGTIVLSDMDGTLKVVDRSSDRVRTVSRTGSMMDIAFTSDGSGIVFREASTDASHRRHVAVKNYNLATGATTTIAAPSRTLEAVELRGNVATTIDAGRASDHVLGREAAAAVSRPVPSIERGLLYLTVDGTRRLASPLGTRGMSYLWPSVSPDGTRLLFFAAGYGTYTCRIDGTDMHRLGYLYAPVWYDNETVVGMQTHDDGVVTYEGRIIAAAADGTEFQTLTEPSLIAVLPAAAPGRISFTTTDGEMYILNVTK